MRKRGYRFITLEDALSDQAYSLPDTYVGEEGTSWLDHWAITMGKPLQGFPEVPASIMERHAALTKPRTPSNPEGLHSVSQRDHGIDLGGAAGRNVVCQKCHKAQQRGKSRES